jgi:phosphoenolpyruvate-protein kinase (PTS system EI component)
MWGIPAVVGLGTQIIDIQSDTIIALDGSNGRVLVNPTSGIRFELEDR